MVRHFAQFGYFTLFLFTILFAPRSQANSPENLVAHITTVAISVASLKHSQMSLLRSQLTPAHIYCVHGEWLRNDLVLKMAFTNLLQKDPQAFQVGEFQVAGSLCLNTAHLKSESFPLFRSAIQRLGTLSHQTIAIPVDPKLAIDSNLKLTKERSVWAKLGRAELMSQAGQLFSVAILFATPKEFTKWESGFGPELYHNAGKNLKRAWTNPPVMDKDNFNTNYIAHPMSGSFYYNSVRSQGFDVFSSFLFSVANSTFWEYGTEALFEQPSIQDLIATPVLGSILGELTHQGTQLLRKGRYTTFEKILVTIINPAYVINHGYR